MGVSTRTIRKFRGNTAANRAPRQLSLIGLKPATVIAVGCGVHWYPSPAQYRGSHLWASRMFEDVSLALTNYWDSTHDAATH